MKIRVNDCNDCPFVVHSNETIDRCNLSHEEGILQDMGKEENQIMVSRIMLLPSPELS